MSVPRNVAARICPLCEAMCGLIMEVEGPRVVSVTPNTDDLFSRGHACAKGLGLARIENDPDRIRTPLLRDTDGVLQSATWDEAFAFIARRLPEFVQDDPGTCAVYAGNPAGHHLDPILYLGTLLTALGTQSLFTPASVDTMPKSLSHLALYGSGLGMSLPDVDRTDYLLVLGSNPLVSQGSTVSAPGMEKRLRALRERGGTLVVVDPARTRTAEVADRHLAVLPGTDALLLLGLIAAVDEAGLVQLGDAAPWVDGLEDVLALAREFPPEAVAEACGLTPQEIREVAVGFARADRAVAHSRIGSCMQEFGTLTNWLIEVLTIVTGNLDRPGGAMFALPAAGGPNTWPAARTPRLTHDRWRSRVRGLPETAGELPAVCFAEEILTPGPGRTRALITIAGNPARSLPRSGSIEAALAHVDLMISVDCYVNETTRHADVILPPPPLASRTHHDVAISHFQVRNVARCSLPQVELEDDQLSEAEILLRLCAAATGDHRSPAELDDDVASVAVGRAARLAGVPVEQVAAAVADRSFSQRLLDLRLRSGPYGDRFGEVPGGLTLALLEEHPEGVDYGPLQPRLPEVLRTPNGRIDLVPPLITQDLPRLRARRDQRRGRHLLITRRQRRGMNTWLHNALPQPDDGQCALFMCPEDASRAGLHDGDRVTITSDIASIVTELTLTKELRPGVVSLPHGWGHTGPGLQTTSSVRAPGANYNALVDDGCVDAPTWSPVLNGVPVTVSRA